MKIKSIEYMENVILLFPKTKFMKGQSADMN